MRNRFSMTRESYLSSLTIEKTIEKPELQAVVYYYRTAKGQPGAIAFSGKRNKHDFYFIFRSDERREQKTTEYFAGLIAHETMLHERKNNRQQPNKLQVGDILNFTWGYEQTNQDYFQVLQVKGQFVIIREIASKQTERNTGNSMAAYVVPVKDSFVAESMPMKKLVQYGDTVTMASYGYCKKWDGKEDYSSWYA